MDKVVAIAEEIEQLDLDFKIELSKPVRNEQMLADLRQLRAAAADRHDRALQAARLKLDTELGKERLKLDAELGRERLRLESIRISQEQFMVGAVSGLRRGNAVAGTIANASSVLDSHVFVIILTCASQISTPSSLVRSREGLFRVSAAPDILNSILRCSCARNGRG
jgi:hypothetical protein